MSKPAPEGEFLKCDAPECDHFEMTPVTIDIVDKPCPKCGANLCTKEDFITFRTYAAAQRSAQEVFLRDHPDAQATLVATNIHGSTMRCKVDPVIGENPFPNKSESSV